MKNLAKRYCGSTISSLSCLTKRAWLNNYKSLNPKLLALFHWHIFPWQPISLLSCLVWVPPIFPNAFSHIVTNNYENFKILMTWTGSLSKTNSTKTSFPTFEKGLYFQLYVLSDYVNETVKIIKFLSSYWQRHTKEKHDVAVALNLELLRNWVNRRLIHKVCKDNSGLAQVNLLVCSKTKKKQKKLNGPFNSC